MRRLRRPWTWQRLGLRLFGVVVAIVALIGTSWGVLAFKPSLFSDLVADRGVRVERDVAYGPLGRHRLDIYRPQTAAADGPIVVFYYGGGWRSGHRATYGFVGAALAARGITAVIPDYRLYPEVRFPGFVEDAALAYRWVAATLAVATGGTRSIYVMGHSAGGHSAAMLAYDRHYIAAGGGDPPRPKGLIGLAGPYAFDPTTWPSTAAIFAGAASPDSTRPVTFVGPGAPPALLVHGLADTTVKPWKTRDLAAALTASGSVVRKVEVESMGHIGVLLAIARPFRWRAPVLEEIIGFIGAIEGRKPP